MWRKELRLWRDGFIVALCALFMVLLGICFAAVMLFMLVLNTAGDAAEKAIECMSAWPWPDMFIEKTLRPRYEAVKLLFDTVYRGR